MALWKISVKTTGSWTNQALQVPSDKLFIVPNEDSLEKMS